MMPRKPLIGQRFGMLTVLSDIWDEHGKHLCACRCDCGNEVVRDARHLRNAQNKKPLSCGCNQIKKNKTHSGSFYNAYWYLTFWHPETKGFWPTRAHFAKQAVTFKGYDPTKRQHLTRIDARKPYGPSNMMWRTVNERHD